MNNLRLVHLMVGVSTVWLTSHQFLNSQLMIAWIVFGALIKKELTLMQGDLTR